MRRKRLRGKSSVPGPLSWKICHDHGIECEFKKSRRVIRDHGRSEQEHLPQMLYCVETPQSQGVYGSHPKHFGHFANTSATSKEDCKNNTVFCVVDNHPTDPLSTQEAEGSNTKAPALCIEKKWCVEPFGFKPNHLQTFGPQPNCPDSNTVRCLAFLNHWLCTEKKQSVESFGSNPSHLPTFEPQPPCPGSNTIRCREIHLPFGSKPDHLPTLGPQPFCPNSNAIRCRVALEVEGSHVYFRINVA